MTVSMTDRRQRWGRIAFSSDRGRRLAALFGIPPRKRPPAVVFAHGWGSRKEDSRMFPVAQRLWDLGIASLLPDLTAHGQSEGNLSEATPERWAADLGAAVRHLHGRDEADDRCIGLAGFSLGGTAALIATALGLKVRALVLWAPLMEGYMHLASQIHVPTLVVQGDADRLLWSSKVLADALGSWGHLAIVSGAGHLFHRPEHLDEAVRLTTAWLQYQMLAAPAGGGDASVRSW